MLVFSTQSYDYLGDRVAQAKGFERGKLERKRFPDGERYQRVRTDVAGRDVVLVGGTISDEDTLEIFDLACALVHQGAHILTLAIPWFGYQTMERAANKGEVVVAKTRARLISSLPTAGSGNRVVLIDLHSEGITNYFSGSIRPVHLYARPVTLRQIRAIGGDDFVLGATDAGRAKWVESLANELGVEAAFVFKRRIDGERTEVQALAADVKNKKVVIYDDMIRSGGSLLGAAQAYRDAGASTLAAVCTHGVFPNDALSRIEQSGLLTELASTDTHPNAVAQAEHPILTVDSIADLLADFLRSHG